jgi:dimethylhistidine N-methyltransferase
MPNDTGFPPSPAGAPVADAAVANAALAGLTAARKTLPPMLFYDDEGCRLFYEITRLPEYYLTRTETALLGRIAGELVPDDFAGAALVEFGGSDETKARYLLDLPGCRFATYVPLDVAEPSLWAMHRRMAETHPGLTVIPVAADFMQPLRLPALAGQRMGYFPGSTVGNLDPADATRFLASARGALGAGSWFVLGADLRKSPDILLPAYNDSAGVTAAFNLNMLVRLNRETGADFDIASFRHEAVWNDSESRIEMHLVSLREHTVLVAGQAVHFALGETIHTENSYKHAPEALLAIAAAAGWESRRVWTDPEGRFGVFLLRSG